MTVHGLLALGYAPLKEVSAVTYHKYGYGLQQWSLGCIECTNPTLNARRRGIFMSPFEYCCHSDKYREEYVRVAVSLSKGQVHLRVSNSPPLLWFIHAIHYQLFLTSYFRRICRQLPVSGCHAPKSGTKPGFVPKSSRARAAY